MDQQKLGGTLWWRHSGCQSHRRRDRRVADSHAASRNAGIRLARNSVSQPRDRRPTVNPGILEPLLPRAQLTGQIPIPPWSTAMNSHTNIQVRRATGYVLRFQSLFAEGRALAL